MPRPSARGAVRTVANPADLALFPEGTGKEAPATKGQSTRRGALFLNSAETDPLEAKEQESLFITVDLHMKAVPDLFDLYAVPNGGKRDGATAKAMQRQGLRPGVADMALDVPRIGHPDGLDYHGLKIELKRNYHGEISEHQATRLTRNARNGYRAVVCWGWNAAWEEILWYLNREDLLFPTGHRTSRIVEAYPEFPFWQRKPIRQQMRI